jgi:hypothetical protein
LEGSGQDCREEAFRCIGGMTKPNIRGILLKSCETKRWRQEFVYSKWLGMNEDAAYMEVLTRTNVIEIKNIGEYLFSIYMGKYSLQE